MLNTHVYTYIRLLDMKMIINFTILHAHKQTHTHTPTHIHTHTHTPTHTLTPPPHTYTHTHSQIGNLSVVNLVPIDEKAS